MTKTILLLGGTGNTGKLIAQHLLEQSGARIIIAGRNEARANETAEQLNRLFPGRVSAKRVDASSQEELVNALEGVALLAAASSTSQFAGQTARACLIQGADYFDVQYSTEKLKTLNQLKGQIEAKGLCFVTDGGFHPGLPAVLIRAAAAELDQIHSAFIGSVIKIDWSGLQFSNSTIRELAEEILHYEMKVLKDHQWKNVPLSSTADFMKMDFGAPFNKQACAPMFLEELRPLPDMFPSLQTAGFFVGGFNPVVDNVILPFVYIMVKVAPASMSAMGRLLEWGLKTFSRPPYGTLLKLEAAGIRNGAGDRVDLLIAHADGYALTAIPAAACLLQMLDESTRKPGLHLQALFVDPDKLFSDMEKMGVKIQR